MPGAAIVVRGLLGAVLAGAALGCTTGPAPTAPPASTPNAPSAAAGVSIPPGFPIGTWVATITEADLRAAGITESGLIKENAATYTRTILPDGTWTVVSTSTEDIRFPVFRGTWRATKPNEFEEVTTFPPEYEGEAVLMTWTMTTAGLELRLVTPPDPIYPVITETHPWVAP
jgi:hypothetical protein